MGEQAVKSGAGDDARIVGLRSDYELFTPEQDIVVHGGPGGGGALKADRKVDGDRRRELIKSVRGGEHVELTIRARTFRQKDGAPNKNYLRLNPAKLPSIAGSFAGKPMLLDHRSWSQSARIGTIVESAAEEQGHGWTAFLQTLQVVKPEAVISVLDGTLDRFSIGWSRIGGVVCTAHKVDVTKRGSCGCWPGDVVEIEGAKHTVEFEFLDAEGTEVSGVNTPAVSGTRIEDVRAALSFELGLHRKETGMQFTRLAAILGLAALASATDEDQAISAIESLKRGKLAAEQERDTARTELDTAKKTAAQAVAKALSGQIDGLLEGAYKGGKLRYGRDEDGNAVPSKKEARLRRIAKEDGIDALKAELDEMDVVVPVNRRQLDADPPRSGSELADGGALSSVAEQLGLDVKDIEAELKSLNSSQEV
jgi:hypothetical protein